MHTTKTLLLVLLFFLSRPGAAQIANRFDVVITEIMADPTPVVGLPNAEYIELKNTSAIPYNLNGWRLSDAAGTAFISTLFVLHPDSTVVLCATSQAAAFAQHGRAIGLAAFPSLDNDGELLTLRSPQGKIIHAVQYHKDWYRNEVKSSGGWSLEMIDAKNPCTGSENWQASTNSSGGTPGKANAVSSTNPDNTPPQVQRAYTTDSVTVVLSFNESLDSTAAALPLRYSIPGFTVTSAVPVPPLFQLVQLSLATPLQQGVVYPITVTGVTDCSGNAVGAFNHTNVGLRSVPAASDIVINELLFDPRPGAFDYVEFYNRSKKIIDAAELFIANRTGTGAAGAIRRLSEQPFYLFPGDYLVATENKESLQKEYLVKDGGAVVLLPSLPPLPNDKGTVVLLTTAGMVIDEVAYDKNWHFALLSNTEGVALERTHPEAPSQRAGSWHSAASTAGYGTPTGVNSQDNKEETNSAVVAVLPAIFSPDNDGRDDVVTIHYQVEGTGYVGSVSIFDAGGRLVRQLVKNDLLSLKGSWKWDGLGERQNRLSIGTYIIYTELFTTDGKKKGFKNTVVLARPLN